MTSVTETEMKAHQEKIGGKRVTLDGLCPEGRDDEGVTLTVTVNRKMGR